MPYISRSTQEDFLAHLTDAAYQVLLRQGLQRPFVDVELELWQEIRTAAQRELAEPPSTRPSLGHPAFRPFPVGAA